MVMDSVQIPNIAKHVTQIILSDWESSLMVAKENDSFLNRESYCRCVGIRSGDAAGKRSATSKPKFL